MSLKNAAYLIFIFLSLKVNVQSQSQKSEQLDSIDILLDSLASQFPHDYNPVLLIEASFGLQNFSKEEALARIDSSSQRINSGFGDYGLFLLLRYYFDLPDGMQHPEVQFGLPDINPPQSSLPSNRFPLIIVNEIPFQIIQGYQLGGLPQSIREHIVFYSKHGIINKRKSYPKIGTADELLQAFNQVWMMNYGRVIENRIELLVSDQINLLLSGKSIH